MQKKIAKIAIWHGKAIFIIHPRISNNTTVLKRRTKIADKSATTIITAITWKIESHEKSREKMTNDKMTFRIFLTINI